MILYPRVAFMC